MKKVVLCLMFICASVLVWGQTDRGNNLLKQANAGNATAQGELAECYEFGDEGIAKDLKQAVSWYTKAADQGDMFSITKLALAYKEGRLDVTVDDQKYVHYMKKAAEGGSAEHMTDLAVCYRDGKYGFHQDDNQFLTWIKKAIDTKFSKALYEVAYYYNGKNNRDDAVKWYKECADYYYFLYGKNHANAIKDLQQLGVNYDPTTVDGMTFRANYKYPSTSSIKTTGADSGTTAVTESNNTDSSLAAPQQEASPKKTDKAKIINGLKEADKVVKGIKNLIKK